MKRAMKRANWQRTNYFAKVPRSNFPLLSNPLHKVWLMSLGHCQAMVGNRLYGTNCPRPVSRQMTISFWLRLVGVLGTTTFYMPVVLPNSPK